MDLARKLAGEVISKGATGFNYVSPIDIPEMGISEAVSGSSAQPAQTSAAQPASNGAYEGAMYYDTSTGQTMTYRDGRWQPNSSTSVPDAMTSAPRGGSGGSGGGSAVNQGAINNTQSTINEIPGLLKAALEAEARGYRNTNKAFDASETNQRDIYGESTTTNQQNYDANFMDSIRAGIKGLGGLTQMLRGSGAGGGSAQDQAYDIVGGVTSQDIRSGADVQKENQGALDSSLTTFLTDLSGKRQKNEDTNENNKRAIQRESDVQLQDLFGKMAGYYGDAGNTAEANNWLNKSSRLTPNIARNSKTQVSNYDTSPVTVKAPEVTAFAGPSQPDVSEAPRDGQIGSGIFTMGEERRRKELAGV